MIIITSKIEISTSLWRLVYPFDIKIKSDITIPQEFLIEVEIVISVPSDKTSLRMWYLPFF